MNRNVCKRNKSVTIYHSATMFLKSFNLLASVKIILYSNYTHVTRLELGLISVYDRVATFYRSFCHRKCRPFYPFAHPFLHPFALVIRMNVLFHCQLRRSHADAVATFPPRLPSHLSHTSKNTVTFYRALTVRYLNE